MEQKKTTLRVVLTALAALTVAGALAAPQAAFADDKSKGKKNTPVIIGPITTTNDPPPKKK